MNKSILIIGSGWLGLPLAMSLANKNYHVTATTTSEEKCQNANSGLPIILLDANNFANTAAEIKSLTPDIMVITIAPSKNNSNYFNGLCNLASSAKAAGVKRVMFISSSSIWGNTQGLVTEQTPVNPQTNSAIAMNEFELLLQQESSFETCALRLTGLFNEQRHPGRFLSGKVDVANPDAPVNMIHQHDCIGLIHAILVQKSWQDVYIGCAPSHPTRREFYTHCATTLGVIAPQFVAKGGNEHKKISANSTAANVNYQYQHPDLMACFTPS